MLQFDSQREFLLRPRPARTESLRSLLNRLAAQNRLPLPMFGEPGRLSDATKMAVELAARSGWERQDLMRRASWKAPTPKSQGSASIGTSLLGTGCLIGRRRRICPLCIETRLWTPIDWELRINNACHIHRCLLIDKCSQCGELLSWLTHQPECGKCRLRWSEMVPSVAPAWSARLARWLHFSIAGAVRDRRPTGLSTDVIVRIPIEKWLLLIDVLRHEVLRRWLSSEIWDQYNAELSVQLLSNLDYRAWLWSHLFLHAAKEPMTLAKALMPTGSALTISSYFNGFSTMAPVPQFVISFLSELGESKLLRRLSSRDRFDTRLHGVHGFVCMERSLVWTDKETYNLRKEYDRVFHAEPEEDSSQSYFLSVC